MKMEQIECSETSAYKIQTPGNHPEENIQQIYVCFLCATPLKFLNQLADFYGTWYVGYKHGGGGETKPLSLIPYNQQ
jgi:hypothetical protein